MTLKWPKSKLQTPTLALAQKLLGQYLVRKIKKKILIGQIIETEAYLGFADRASHAHRGQTKRNAPMFGPAGHWYVYLIYGMHYCLNLVTEKNNYPAAVLIRGLKPIAGLGLKTKLDGPGKICRAFKIDKKLNQAPAFGPTAQLWLATPQEKIKGKIKKYPRLNIDYAGEDKNKLWRFKLE